MKGYELTILVQGCRFTATKQRESSAMLISTANLNKLQPCFNHSHPLVAHPLGAKAVAAVLFLFQLPLDKYFPLVRQSSSMGKSPHAGRISTLHNPMRSLPQLGKEPGFENLSALLIMLSASGDFPFFEGDAGAMFTGRKWELSATEPPLPFNHCLTKREE